MYAKIYRWENLLLAYNKAAKGKRGQSYVADFEHRLEENLLTLQHELATQTYQPGPYSSFHIHEPKRRLISAAPFRDRVVHHALCNIIEPTFEASFIDHSYANRVGKGTHRALDRVQGLARRYPFVLQCDLRQFFPSIDHEILRKILGKTLSKKRMDDGDEGDDLRHLIDLILASGTGVLTEEYDMVYFTGDNLLAATRARGLPIGNLTSQFWANCYMNPFDHFVQRRLGCSAYTRYVDDFILFAKDKAILWQWKKAIEEKLATMRLTIHSGTHPKPVGEGIPFLGFIVYPDKKRLKRRKAIHYQRKLSQLQLAYRAKEISFAQLDASVQGWINHARYGNTIGLRKAVLGKSILGKSKSAILNVTSISNIPSAAKPETMRETNRETK